MLLQHAFPPDIRVENEAASLLAAGHDVHLLCSEDRRGAAELPPTLDELVVHAVPNTWNQLPRWKRRLMNAPLLWFLNVYWVREIAALARREGRFDAIHVHDLPLVRTGRRAAKKMGTSVVADLHENYPMALEYYRRGRTFTRIARFRRSPRRWERYERRSVPSCDAVIAVVDEMKTRLVSLGVAEEKIAVVENYVDVDRFLSYPRDPGPATRFAGRFVIGYAGVFGHTRGLDMAIRAMKRVVRELPDATMLLVGEGPVRPDL
jgi:glycosyltransferase involved in cell wall biosynthesis